MADYVDYIVIVFCWCSIVIERSYYISLYNWLPFDYIVNRFDILGHFCIIFLE